MSKTAQYAILGLAITAYLGLGCYFLLRGWRGDALIMLATVPAIILGIIADRRSSRCGLLCRRRGHVPEERS